MFGRVWKKNRGSVIVETAVMFMIVTMLAVGYIYFTQAMRINTVAKIAAREGARQYAVTNDSYAAKEKVLSELALGGVDPGAAYVATKASGNKRMVTVQIRHAFYTPFVGECDLDLRGAAEYKLEQNPDFYQKEGKE